MLVLSVKNPSTVVAVDHTPLPFIDCSIKYSSTL